jgi:hypothetical protein
MGVNIKFGGSKKNTPNDATTVGADVAPSVTSQSPYEPPVPMPADAATNLPLPSLPEASPAEHNRARCRASTSAAVPVAIALSP